jgi:DNA-binding NarL/FixJ family response regulator
VRVVIAEDNVLLRDGMAALLHDHGIEVLTVVDNAEDLLAAVAAHRPDIAVVDVRMPPSHTDEGLRAAVDARSRVPGTPILVLSQYVEASYADDLLADGRGGIGYLLKDRVADVADFLDGLTRVAAGGTVLDPEVVAQLFARRRRHDPLASLTAREREVLGLMAEGRSNTAIARQMVVTEGAVEKHVSSIFAKLDLPPAEQDHRRVLAVLRWLEHDAADA